MIEIPNRVLARLGEAAEQAKLDNAVQVVYVPPLRSLNRDMERNMAGPLAAVNEALPAERQLREMRETLT